VPRLLGWERARIRDRVEQVMELVGLPDRVYGARYPHQLSGGEAQRVGVARALASDPPILLMDEPFSAVDPLGRHRLQEEFLEIQRRLKKTVVFVTHDVDEAVRLGDRIALLKEGHLIQYDRTEVLLETPADLFVGDFLGRDRTLKRLSRVPASALARSEAGDASTAALPEDLDLRLVLSHFLESGTDVVALKDRQDRITGWLHRRDLEARARVGEPS
jgi:osmoprotectant transport system ATP-binding protein